MKLIKTWISFSNSRAQHHLEIFTLASAFPHAIFLSATSSDEVSSLEIDELDKPQLLRKTDEKLDFFQQPKYPAQFGNNYLSIRVPKCNITKRTVDR